MINQSAELGTLAAKIEDNKMLSNRNIVKVITKKNWKKIIFQQY